jgi:hypothetical protein
MARYEKAEDRSTRIPDGTAISRGAARYGFAAILLLGAPFVFLAATQAPAALEAPATPARDSARVTRYLIVSGDSSSGSWDSRDEPRFKLHPIAQ